MSFRTCVVLMVLWITSLFAARAMARGQSFGFVPAPEPTVLSGADVGFRLEGTIGDAPAGTIVIRQNGQWVEPRWRMKPHLIR